MNPEVSHLRDVSSISDDVEIPYIPIIENLRAKYVSAYPPDEVILLVL
jgi:hypothetical protein